MKSNLRRKIKKIVRNSYKPQKTEMLKRWKYETQIVDNLILPEIKKLSKDKILEGVKVYVELDAIFLNIRMENVKDYIFHEKYSHPDDAIAEWNVLKDYFQESGYIAQESDYGFYVILKP